MSVAPAKTAPAPSRYDAFRSPRVRHAMHLLIPKTMGGDHRIEVRETRAGVRLMVDKDDDGIGVMTVDLSLSEATKLAEMLNVIRRRATSRKEWDR